MKFNLQHFVQVKDEFGEDIITPKKKKKIVPKLPTVPKTVTPVVAPPIADTFISSRDAAAAGTAFNPNTGEKLGTFEEGKAQRKQLRADTAAEIAGRTATTATTGVPSLPEVETGPTQEELNAQLKAASRGKLVTSLNDLIEAGEKSALQETKALTTEFRDVEGRLRTRDTMSRAGKSKFLDIGNLGAAGQVGQTALGQNVITQGARTSNVAQEQQLKADVQSRLSDIKAQAARDLSNFDFDVEIQELESQLRSAEAQAEYEREREILIESRGYDDYVRQVEQADDIEILEIKSLIADEKAFLDAEIDEARASNDFTRDVEFAERQAAIDLQLEVIRQSGRLSLEGARAANTRTEIGLRGDEARETAEFKESLDSGDLEEDDAFKPTITTIAKAISTAVGDADFLDEAEIKDKTLEWIMQNEKFFIGDVNLLQETMLRTGITERELEEYETWRETVLANEAFQ